MKKYFILVLSLSYGFCSAQEMNPVDWSFSAKKKDAKTYEVHLTAMIEPGWHVYSGATPAGGPVPTAVTFSKNPLLAINGKIRELGKLENHYEKLFKVTVKQFSNKVDFVQLVKLKAPVKTNISGNVEFMACNDEMCLPPQTIHFSVPLQ